jgi:hypothetical protein
MTKESVARMRSPSPSTSEKQQGRFSWRRLFMRMPLRCVRLQSAVGKCRMVNSIRPSGSCRQFSTTGIKPLCGY